MKRSLCRKLLRESAPAIDGLSKTGILKIEGKTHSEILALAATLAVFVMESSEDRANTKRLFSDMIDELYSLKVEVPDEENHHR